MGSPIASRAKASIKAVVARFERARFVLTETEVAAWVAQRSMETPEEALGF
jgi:hypothetical protein